MRLSKTLLTGLTAAILLSGCNHNVPDLKTGQRAYKSEDYETAFQHYQQLADFGMPRAKTELGKLYLYGKGTERDPARALALFREAEELGEDRLAPRYISRAKAYLGSMALKDKPGTPSAEEGVELLREAANKGSPRALFELGLAYERGLGVPQNVRTAEQYYKQASAKGYGRADFYRGQLYQDGELGGVANPQLALTLFKQAAENGYPRAYQELGRMFADGEGVPRNLQVAREYFAKAEAEGVEVEEDLARLESNYQDYL